MSDQPEQPVDAAETVAPPTPDEPAAEKKPTETVEFWKSKAREQEKRAKDNALAAAELATLKDAQKSEQQKLIERAEAAEQRAALLEAAREIDGWKSDIAKKTGVPADVLRGATLDELEEHAASLKALLPPTKPGQVRAEGRTVTSGTGDPAQQFAEIIRGART